MRKTMMYELKFAGTNFNLAIQDNQFTLTDNDNDWYVELENERPDSKLISGYLNQVENNKVTFSKNVLIRFVKPYSISIYNFKDQILGLINQNELDWFAETPELYLFEMKPKPFISSTKNVSLKKSLPMIFITIRLKK